MALRNQPYIPLFVQDVLTDEKLMECGVAAHGVYFRLLCILHKQETYGKLLLKAKYKQNESKTKAFATLLSKPMPFNSDIIERALTELIDEEVIYIEGDYLCQKRMIRDSDLSNIRANAGSKGGKIGRNSGTKRYYNAPGYLYLIYDEDDKKAFKIGISQDPDKRIYGIIRKTGRENLKFRRRWHVEDMGKSEQKVLDYFNDIRDGEWIFGNYTIIEIEKQIKSIIKSKSKANTEYETEYETDIDIRSEDKRGEIQERGESDRKSPVKAISSTKQFIDWYCNEYLERFNKKYLVSGAKDGNLVKKLLSHFTLEDLKDIAILFFEAEDDFIIHSGYTIGVFYSQINRLQITGGKTINKKTLANMVAYQKMAKKEGWND